MCLKNLKHLKESVKKFLEDTGTSTVSEERSERAA
jgi:hypothetical protein